MSVDDANLHERRANKRLESQVDAQVIIQLEKAYEHSNDQSALLLQLAQAYQRAGQAQRAIQLLSDFLQRHPQAAPVFFYLGTLWFLEKVFHKASECFEQAIRLKPDYVNAYYYFGLSELNLGHKARAQSAFQAVLELDSQHFASQFQLGVMAMQSCNFQLAQRYFSSLHEHFPKHHETLVNLATSYFQLAQFELAERYYLKAFEENSKDTQSLFNLGVLSERRGELKRAEHYYQAICELDPYHADARHNWGVLCLKQNQREFALAHFLLAETCLPAAQRTHLIAMLTGEQLTRASSDYIEQLFEGYAAHYETHLIQVLQYQVPKMLYEWVQTISSQSSWRLLDLGCGTGLVADYFREQIEFAVGVDLSASMLEQARAKKIYHQLHQLDILEFISKTKNEFNLIAAADVLVYFGDLSELLSKLVSVMTVGGLFVFNLEKENSSEVSYRLSSTGRFTHALTYVESLIVDSPLSVLAKKELVLRENQGKQVMGIGYILMKE